MADFASLLSKVMNYWSLGKAYRVLFVEAFIVCPLSLLMPVKPGKDKNTNGSEDVFTFFFID